MTESAQYRSGLSTRQTAKTDGEATVGESVGTADGRGQPRADGRGQTHADRQRNSEDGFFMTQVGTFLPLPFIDTFEKIYSKNANL